MTERICKNCKLFIINEVGVKATDVASGEEVASGKRNCSAGNVAWADCECPTGQFEEKLTPEP